MKKSNYLLTVLRNGKYVTLVYFYMSLVDFLLIERELGNETFLLNAVEISDVEYTYYTSIK